MTSWFRSSGTAAAATPPRNADPALKDAANGRPLLLIGFNGKEWELGQEAVKMLQSVRGPLSAMAVCGRARQGKSFLLNQLLVRLTGVEKPNGFVVSPTHQSCTRGLWIWSAPIPVVGADGKRTNTVRRVFESVCLFGCAARRAMMMMPQTRSASLSLCSALQPKTHAHTHARCTPPQPTTTKLN